MINTLGDVVTLGLIVAALIVVPYKIAKAWLVKHSAEDSNNVMSRSESSALPVVPLSSPLDRRQTDNRQRPFEPTPEQYLTLFTILRAAGIKREEIRPALKEVGLKLDNNLWSQAAPPADEELTPIAHRRTTAHYPEEPELEYRPPA